MCHKELVKSRDSDRQRRMTENDPDSQMACPQENASVAVFELVTVSDLPGAQSGSGVLRSRVV